jgi:protein-S-isoprenylcysteine O-methyltransferase Ste14
LLRHLLSVLLLPCVATILVPVLLAGSFAESDTRWNAEPGRTFGMLAGGLFGAIGMVGFTWCLTLFARVGRGTLAPWDPTRSLVAQGPYRYVRNPMITSVALVLLGEAVYLGSRVIASWLIAFVVINHVYFVLSEEPGLERRFGSDYRAYRNRVPRWLPRAGRVHGG